MKIVTGVGLLTSGVVRLIAGVANTTSAQVQLAWIALLGGVLASAIAAIGVVVAAKMRAPTVGATVPPPSQESSMRLAEDLGDLVTAQAAQIVAQGEALKRRDEMIKRRDAKIRELRRRDQSQSGDAPP